MKYQSRIAVLTSEDENNIENIIFCFCVDEYM